MKTEAGKLYLDWDRDPDLWVDPFHERFGRYWTYPEVIAAIEAEVVASERARIAEAVRGLDDLTGHMTGKYHDAYAQVMFALEAAPKP